MKKSFILSACLFSFTHIMCMEEQKLNVQQQEKSVEEDALTIATRTALKSLSIKKRSAAVSCLVNELTRKLTYFERNNDQYYIKDSRTLKKLGIISSEGHIKNSNSLKKMFDDPAFVKDILEIKEK